MPLLKLREAHPILYFYLAVAHSNTENFARASAFALAAADTCDENDSDLKAQITSLQSQLNQIIETLKSNEDARFMQFLEPILQANNWYDALLHLEDYCFDKIVLGHRVPGSDEPNVTLPTIYRSIHPMILFYLAVAYARNQYPETALKMANIALSDCKSEHEDIRSQLEGLIGQLQSTAHAQELSEIVELLSEDEKNWGIAMGKLDTILENDKRNAIAYFYHAICMQRLMSTVLENLEGNIDAAARDAIRNMCTKLSEDIENARYYGAKQDKVLQQQLDALDQFHDNICSRL